MSYPVRPWRARGVARDPFAALESMNRLFGETLTGYRGRSAAWHSDVEVDEDDEGWVVEVRLPGVAPDEVSVDITDRELHIRSRSEGSDGGDEAGAGGAAAESGEGGEAGEGGEGQPAATEAPKTARSRRWGSFSYRLTIPSDVDPDRIDATMDHGLLTVRLPRSTKSRARQINVGRKQQSIEGESTPQAGS
jgi:HSP20 family protein